MSTTEKSLHEFLVDEYEYELQDAESFVIDSKEKAIWAMRIIAEHAKAINENSDAANKEIQRIEEWREAANKEHCTSIDYLSSLLEGYHRRLYRETDGKTKTVKLPHGQLKIRAQRTKFERDDEVLKAFVKGAGYADLVETRELLRWAELKALLDITEEGKVIFTPTGELIENGIKAERQDSKFSIDVVVE